MISAGAISFRDRLHALSERPFCRLTRHCVQRIFFGGEAADSGEVDVGIGAMLAILAAPGAFISMALASKYGSLFLWFRGFYVRDPIRALQLRGANLHFDPFTASLADEYFFIVLSMVAAGAVAIWKWDSLLPDRRDYANLAPLPIPSRHFFFANLAALLLVAGILSIDINAASSILFPFLAASSQEVGYAVVFFATHLVSVILGAAFGFLSVLAILGVLMALLPYPLFRKSSVYIRSGLLILFVALLTTSFSEPAKIERLQTSTRSWRGFPPPAWFVGLCQSMRGLHSPLFSNLGVAATAASVCALLLALAGYAISYRRCFLRSAETMVVLPAGGGRIARLALRVLDKILLRDSFQRAGFRFVIKGLFRSEKHSLIWIGFTGIGVIVAAQTVFAATALGHSLSGVPSAGLLGVPLVLTYFLMFGLRFAFEIPAPLRANWTFRFGVDAARQNPHSLARSVMLLFEVPLVLSCFGAYSHYWGWRIGLVHTLVVAAMAALLAETLLLGFRKIPFTCTSPPFKQTSIVLLLLYVVGLYVYSIAIPALEYRAFENPFPFEEMIVIVLALWGICLYTARRNQNDGERLIFEDLVPPAVEVLDLTFRR